MRKIEVNLHDTHIGLWQADANDPTFRAEIYEPLLRLMKRNGWHVAADPRILKHYRCLSKNNRLCARGDLRAEISCSGRVVEIDLWSEAARQDNSNGRRYDFDKRERAPYLDRVRFDLETRRVLAWLGERAELTAKPRRDVGCGADFGQLTSDAHIERRIRETGHYVPELGRARFYNSPREQTSGDGKLLAHGAQVWFRDRKGRILRGQAFYILGQNWLIKVGRFGTYHASHWDIFVDQPADLRRKRNEKEGRKRLEQELVKAVRREDYLRADHLKGLLFGKEQVYRIWSRKNDAYYGVRYCGYTSDSASAGRYTKAEAEAEVRRVPHILSLVTPSGQHLTAEQLDMPRAA